MESTATSYKSLIPLPPSLPNEKPYQRNRSLIKASNLKKNCCSVSDDGHLLWDRLFDEAYRADTPILTDNGGIIYAHASVLGSASPVFNGMLRKLKKRTRRNQLPSIRIRGVPEEAVRVFVRYLYSSRYEDEDMNQHALPLLVLSHSFIIPQLKRLCECWLEHRLVTMENVIDVFQIALLCDAPRLSLICHRFILRNIKSVSSSEAWEAMKQSHPVLEKEILDSRAFEEMEKKERARKINEKKVYEQLHEAMEALIHICRDGCRNIGPRDKALGEDQSPCKYLACNGLEALVRHFAGCKMRASGGCVHCKRMWQILKLHSWLCADSEACNVPLCRNFRQRRRRQSKKDDIRWRLLVKKIVRSKSITGAPFFTIESAMC